MQIGFLASASLLGAILATLPAGTLTEALPPRVAALFSVAAVSLMTITLSLAAGFVALFSILMVKGAVARLMEPAVSVAVAARFPGRNRGMAIAAVDAGAPLGQMTIAAILPALAIALGWQTAVVATGFATLMGLPVLARIMRRRSNAPEGSSRTRRPASYRSLWHHRQFLKLIAGQVAYRAVQGGLLTFIILFLHEARGLDVVFAGMMLALTQASGGIARILWAWLQDRFFHDRRAVFIGYLGVVGAAGLAILAFLPHDPGVGTVVLAVVLAGSSIRGMWPSMVTVATELGERRLGAGRSTSIIMLASAAGAVGGPPLFGAIIGTAGYQVAWGLCALGMLVMTILVYDIRSVTPASGF